MKVTIEEKLDLLSEKLDELKVQLNEKETEITEFSGFISQANAIKKYNLSKDWFWRRRNSGELPFRKLGSRVYYSQKDLFNLLEEA